MSAWIKQHSVLTYYVLALVISWSIGGLLMATKYGVLTVPMSLHYLFSFGPMLASIIVTAWIGGAGGLKELWSRITRWRVGWRWFAISTLSPVVLFAVAALVAWILTGDAPNLYLLGQANYLPYLGIGVLPIWLATYGFGEEIGWRGFALPRLQKSMSVARATLVLGVLWLIWHVPSFFYLSTWDKIGLWMLPGFIVGVLFGAVIFTWIYNGTGGSVLMVALWHGIFDLLTASAASQGLITILMSAGVIVWALIVTNLDRPGNFYRVAKQVAE